MPSIVIDERFRGPPNSGNGGYVCGLLAKHVVGGSAEITLRVPPPLGQPLEIVAGAEGAVDLRAGEKVIAVGRPAHVEVSEIPTASYSEAEEARGAVCQAKGGVPAECKSAGSGRDRRDQSHPSRLGELLPDRQFEPLLFDGQALGGAEDSAAHDERPAAPRDGLETVEYAVDSWHARSVQ